MSCTGCGRSSKNCSCRRCRDCHHTKCRCPPRDSRDVELRPRPAAPRVEPASRVSSVPSSVRVNGQPYVPRREDGRSSASIERATVSSTGSARIDNSAFNTRGSSPSSSGSQPYRKETYKDRQDPRYDNTGPPYDPSSSALPPHHQQVVGDTKARGYNDLADRFADQARISSVHSGNHSDQPTYGRDGLYRTASDMESHDSYKRNEDRLRDAKQPYASASQQAPRMQKHTDPQNHLTVADIHGRVGDEHRRIVDGRLNYMETQPGGLADPASFRTHVTAARDGLVGMNASYENRDREREVARNKQLAQQSGAWDQNPSAGGPYHDRPESSSTLNSARSSGRVSKASSSSNSTPAKAFSSGSSVSRRCGHVSRRTNKQCKNMTTHPSNRCSECR